MPVRMMCASHTPLMDHVDADPEIDRQVRAHFAELAREVEEYDPELIVIFGPDHFKGFFYDMMPSFTVGIRAEAIGDYDIGSGDFRVPERAALDCIGAVRAKDVDVAVSYRMQADHGFAQLLVLLTGNVDTYEVLPIHINCAGPPLPTFARVRALGEAVGGWIAEQEKRVLILGSGGLSHDPPIPNIETAPPPVAEMLIAGRNPPIEARRAREQANCETARKLARGEGTATPLAPEWDKHFMSALEQGDYRVLDDTTDAEITKAAGVGGHEVRTWVAAYAAMATATGAASTNGLDVSNVFYHDIPQWNAGMGIARATAA